MLRVGLVGCGHIGTVHAYAIEQLTAAGLVEAALVAVHDTDRDRAGHVARHHGGRAVDDVEDLLDAVEVVWVCTWTSAHRAIVEAASERGLAVFCEKPLARDLAEARAVAAALGRVPHAVGLVLRSAPVFETVARRLAAGSDGRPLATVLRDDQYFPIQGAYRSTWRADVARAGAGTLLEHSIHDLDLLSWLHGTPVDVSARTACRFGHPGIDDTATVTLAHADGSTSVLVSVWHQVRSRGSNRRLEVLCEDAVLATDDDHLGPLVIRRSDGVEVVPGELPTWACRLAVPEGLLEGVARYAAPSKAFLDAVAAGAGPGPVGPGAETALAAHRVVDAAYAAARAGSRSGT